MGVVHAVTLAELPGVESVLISDVDDALAQRVASDLGVVVAPSIEDLLASVDSTLIKALSAVHRPDEGEYLFEGERMDLGSPRDALEPASRRCTRTWR